MASLHVESVLNCCDEPLWDGGVVVWCRLVAENGRAWTGGGVACDMGPYITLTLKGLVHV